MFLINPGSKSIELDTVLLIAPNPPFLPAAVGVGSSSLFLNFALFSSSCLLKT